MACEGGGMVDQSKANTEPVRTNVYVDAATLDISNIFIDPVGTWELTPAQRRQYMYNSTRYGMILPII